MIREYPTSKVRVQIYDGCNGCKHLVLRFSDFSFRMGFPIRYCKNFIVLHRSKIRTVLNGPGISFKSNKYFFVSKRNNHVLVWKLVVGLIVEMDVKLDSFPIWIFSNFRKTQLHILYSDFLYSNMSRVGLFVNT